MTCIFFLRVSWIKHEGVKFQKGACVVLGVNDNTCPIMAVIIDVFIVEGRMLLEIQLLLYQGFDEHINAFTFVEEHSQPIKYIWEYELHDHHVYGLYKIPKVDTRIATVTLLTLS